MKYFIIAGCRCPSCGTTDRMTVAKDLSCLRCRACRKKYLLVHSRFEYGKDGNLKLVESTILPYPKCGI